jgi:hypothetical protein
MVSLFGDSSSSRVAIVYNGVSATNKEALHFLRNEAARADSQYTFDTINAKNGLNRGDYKALIVMNTGFETGVDPVLSGFIQSLDDKSGVILLTFIKGSSEIEVNSYPASPSTEGVDAVSASSLWKHKGSPFKSNKDIKAMHGEWLDLVLQYIDKQS